MEGTQAQQPSMGRRKAGKDEWIEDWPWFGGKPGKSARMYFAIYVVALVVLIVLIVLAIATLHICTAILLVIICACFAALPRLFLYGSRI